MKKTYTVSTITGGTLDFNTMTSAMKYAMQSSIVTGTSFLYYDLNSPIHIGRKYKGIQKVKHRNADFNYKETVLFVWEI